MLAWRIRMALNVLGYETAKNTQFAKRSITCKKERFECELIHDSLTNTWSIHPNTPCPEYNQIQKIVQDMQQTPPQYQHITRPWVLYRLGVPNIPVGRFRKRNDAEQQSLILKRLVPQSEFGIVFQPHE